MSIYQRPRQQNHGNKAAIEIKEILAEMGLQLGMKLGMPAGLSSLVIEDVADEAA